MNYLLPERGVLPLHCSANVGAEGRRRPVLRPVRDRQDDTLRRPEPPPRRRRRARLGRLRHLQLRGRLLRQGDQAVAGGGAADLPSHPLRLRPRERGGRSLTRAIHWDDDSITENTRATYPVDHIPDAVRGGWAGRRATSSSSPATPWASCPRSRSSPPRWPATTSSRGSPPRSPARRRASGSRAHVLDLLRCALHAARPRRVRVDAGQRLAARGVRCWLVNTGWSSGPYGVGERMSIAFTRRLLQAALDGDLDGMSYTPHPVFKVLVPRSCTACLRTCCAPATPGRTRTPTTGRRGGIAHMFAVNFRQYEAAAPELAAAGPAGVA